MKFKKTAAVLFTAATLAFPCASFAQSSTGAPDVQLNGKDITFSVGAPFNEDGHVYVPLRGIADATDSNIDYDAATGMITVKRDSKTVSFDIKNSEITVDENGAISKIKDASSIVREDYTYVPLRVLTEALGCTVGWDDTAKTVIIVDKDLYAKNLTDGFTYADKLTAFMADITAKDKAVSGTVNITTGYKNEDGTDASVAVNFVIAGSQTKDASAYSITVSSPDDSVSKIFAQAGIENEKLINALKGSTMNIVVDSKNNAFYAKGGIIAAALNMSDDAWVSLTNDDLKSLGIFGSDGMKYMFSSSSIGNFRDSINASLGVVPTYDAAAAKTVFNTIDSTLALYKDSSFVKTQTGYTSKSTTTLDETTAMTNTINVNTDAAGNITGYSMNSSSSGMFSMDVNGNFSADGEKMTMTMSVPEIMNLKLALDSKYTYGTQPVVTVPSSNVESLLEKIGGLFQ